MKTGSLIILEGIDGFGGETHSRLLKDFFDKNNIPSVFVKSPDYDHPVGKLYSDYLHEKFDLSTEQVFLVCATDVLNSVKKIKEGLKDKVVIADRYITSTIAYQCANGFSFENALKLVDLLEYPKADLIIFIDIRPETSMRRKMEEHGKLDKYEGNSDFLRKVREFFLKETEENVLGKWITINGERSIDEVHKDILKTINSFNLINLE